MATSSGPGVPRCWGGDPGDSLMTRYHDEEWGVPAHGEIDLFERLALESFQAGLSWATILRKRDAFRRAFLDFDPAIVAGFDDADRARLVSDAGIVRNRAKIEATIGNAVCVLALGAEFGSFDRYLAGRVPDPGRRLPPSATTADVPATTPVAKALSADLRGRGFRFVGPTIVYAFMQSVGLVDDHLPGCYRYGAAAG